MIEQRSNDLRKMKFLLVYQPLPTQFKSCPLDSPFMSTCRLMLSCPCIPTDLSANSYYTYYIVDMWGLLEDENSV